MDETVREDLVAVDKSDLEILDSMITELSDRFSGKILVDQIQVLFKKLRDDIDIPVLEYAKDGDAGCDVRAAEDYTIGPGEIKIIKTGISLAIPYGYEAQVRPRSGMAIKKGLTVVNTPGTIDCGYRGECMVGLINLSKDTRQVEAGDRIAQFVFKPVTYASFKVVDELPSSERGATGFGDSGVK